MKLGYEMCFFWAMRCVFLNNHKNLDPSYKMDWDFSHKMGLDFSHKMDLDFWDCFGRKNLSFCINSVIKS